MQNYSEIKINYVVEAWMECLSINLSSILSVVNRCQSVHYKWLLYLMRLEFIDRLNSTTHLYILLLGKVQPLKWSERSVTTVVPNRVCAPFFQMLSKFTQHG